MSLRLAILRVTENEAGDSSQKSHDRHDAGDVIGTPPCAAWLRPFRQRQRTEIMRPSRGSEPSQLQGFVYGSLHMVQIVTNAAESGGSGRNRSGR
jgi:hypothetical protein